GGGGCGVGREAVRAGVGSGEAGMPLEDGVGLAGGPERPVGVWPHRRRDVVGAGETARQGRDGEEQQRRRTRQSRGDGPPSRRRRLKSTHVSALCVGSPVPKPSPCVHRRETRSSTPAPALRSIVTT